MRVLIKYLLLIGFIELSGIFVILFLAGYKGGLFNRIELQHTTRGPYEIVSLASTASTPGLNDQFFQIRLMLQMKNIQPLCACGIFYPLQHEVNSAHASTFGGFLVRDKIQVEWPYAINTIGPREVIVAKMKAHPDFAPLKIYPKIHAWMKQNHFHRAGPVLEIYHHDGVIECEVPIQRIET